MKPLYIVIVLLSALTASSQELSKQNIKTTIDSAAAKIERYYVYANMGKEIADKLRKKQEQGGFDNLVSWQQLDTVASKFLREISNDGHLYIRYNPDKVKFMLSQTGKPRPGDDFFHSAVAREKNFGIREYKVLDNNIGYLKLDQINISDESLPILEKAISIFKSTKALIIDLRDNGGGGSEIGTVLESIFLPAGKPLLQFTGRHGNIITEKSIPVPPDKKYNQPVFILINNRTASAAEAFSFVLQSLGRATIVGQPSAGAANHNALFPINNSLYVSISEEAPVLPGTRKSWEGTGVKPDVEVPSDQSLIKALQLAVTN